MAPETVTVAINMEHLRLQLDDLERRVEESRDPMERRRIGMECTMLERAVAVVEEDLARDMSALEALRNRLRRLRARA